MKNIVKFTIGLFIVFNLISWYWGIDDSKVYSDKIVTNISYKDALVYWDKPDVEKCYFWEQTNVYKRTRSNTPFIYKTIIYKQGDKKYYSK